MTFAQAFQAALHLKKVGIFEKEGKTGFLVHVEQMDSFRELITKLKLSLGSLRPVGFDALWNDVEEETVLVYFATLSSTPSESDIKTLRDSLS